METFQQVFLEFHYPELKELGLAFLTLASTIFTFTAVFAEKFFGSRDRPRPGAFLVISGWFFLLASIMFGGLGLRDLFLSADFALGGYLSTSELGFAEYVAKTSRRLFTAGGCFFVGMLLLGLGTMLRMALEARAGQPKDGAAGLD